LILFLVLGDLPVIMAIQMEVVELLRGIFFVNLLTNLSGHGAFLEISMTFWMLAKKEDAIIDLNC
jgi:hypothetical protein